MKKLLAIILVAGVFSFGLTQSQGYGVYSGWPTYLGLQFQTANLRLGLGLSGFGFGGDAGLILAKSKLEAAPGVDLSWYYGVGVGAGFWSVGGFSGIYLFPHGLAGIEYPLPGAPFSAYAEAQVGLGVGLGDLAGWRGFSPDFSGRVGVIFR
jgi:hypothetical protein